MLNRYPNLSWASEKLRRQVAKIDQLATAAESSQEDLKQTAHRIRSASDPLAWTSQHLERQRAKRFDDGIATLKAEKKLLENLLSVGESLIDEGAKAMQEAERSLEETGNRLTTELLRIAGLDAKTLEPQLLVRYQHQARTLPNYGTAVGVVEQIKADIDNIRRIHREAKARFLQIDDVARSMITQELGI
jgi:uncharacterized protein YukE